jgi:hypothetical protein
MDNQFSIETFMEEYKNETFLPDKECIKRQSKQILTELVSKLGDGVEEVIKRKFMGDFYEKMDIGLKNAK